MRHCGIMPRKIICRLKWETTSTIFQISFNANEMSLNNRFGEQGEKGVPVKFHGIVNMFVVI